MPVSSRDQRQNRGQITLPPRSLARKVRKGAGLDMAEILARVRQGIDEMRGDFEAEVSAALKDIERALGTLSQASELDQAQHLKQLYVRVHDLRGQAATFDYQLLTDIGSLLCAEMEKMGGRPDLVLLEAHVQGLKAVAVGRVTGDGGAVGRELKESLAALAVKRAAG